MSHRLLPPLSLADMEMVRDGLKSGDIKLGVRDDVARTPEIDRWLDETRDVLVEAYDAIIEHARS